jgi:hypothetical protein
VLQQGERGLAVPIEIGGLPEHRHDAVNTGEFDERIDRTVVESRDQRAKCEADPDLGAKPLPPAVLVGAQD